MNKDIGMCPKIRGSSPGTLIYDIHNTIYAGRPEAFETEFCPKHSLSVQRVVELARFKQSINGQFNQRTSATFSQAQPLYYHFSRYLNTTVDVPVAVMTTMDAQMHLRRVTDRGLELARNERNLAGWIVVALTERIPLGYVPVEDFYYGDPKHGLFYGTMLKRVGKRYGPEFNGNIVGRGYAGQYQYLQKTPAFLALTTPGNLIRAMNTGLI